MKKYILILFVVSLFFHFHMSPAMAQEEDVDRIIVDLTNPSKPVHIDLSMLNGGITVSGTKRQNVLVESKTRLKKINNRRKKDESSNKRKGMFQIPVNSSGMTIEEEDNRIEIHANSWKGTKDISLEVPLKTSLKLKCVNNGDIYVENVDGEFEINNVNGSVTLTNISGSVNAHALNKDLLVTFNKIDDKKPMSFSSLNGDIDVALPKSLKCNVKIKTNNGDAYSDFEIKQFQNPQKIIEENKRGEDGKFRIRIENAFYGSINGGGPELQFNSFNGDIFIRKIE